MFSYIFISKSFVLTPCSSHQMPSKRPVVHITPQKDCCGNNKTEKDKDLEKKPFCKWKAKSKPSLASSEVREVYMKISKQRRDHGVYPGKSHAVSTYISWPEQLIGRVSCQVLWKSNLPFAHSKEPEYEPALLTIISMLSTSDKTRHDHLLQNPRQQHRVSNTTQHWGNSSHFPRGEAVPTSIISMNI